MEEQQKKINDTDAVPLSDLLGGEELKIIVE